MKSFREDSVPDRIKPLEENYFERHFGDKFFARLDARKLDFVRQSIEEIVGDKVNRLSLQLLNDTILTQREGGASMIHKRENRGSEWHLWDLHLHSPTSHDYDNKEASPGDIIKALEQNGVRAAAITDHNRIDVERITKLKELGEERGILILPGIEVSIDMPTEKPIHVIGLFSEISNLRKLETNVRSGLYGGEWPDDKESEAKTVDFKKMLTVFREHNGLISIHAGGRSNSLDNILNKFLSNQGVKQKIAKKIDIFEVNSRKDLEGYEEKVIPELKEKIQKHHPIVVGSDNHDNRVYPRPRNSEERKSKCWIKAELSFEGLRQIVHEPDRVHIGDVKPGTERDKAFVIKSFQFDGGNFPKKPLYLSPNLNSIIGGKSSGKSLLLYHLAKAADSRHVEEKVDKKEGKPMYENMVPGFRITWENGDESTLQGEEGRRAVVYIPQLYLNKLSEDEKIQDIIEGVLDRNSAYTRNRQAKQKEVASINEEIGRQITNYFAMEKKLEEVKSSLRQSGTEQQKEALIKDLQADLKKHGLGHVSEEELGRHRKNKEELDKVSLELNELEKQRSLVVELGQNLKSYGDGFQFELESHLVEKLSHIGVEDSGLLYKVAERVSQRFKAILLEETNTLKAEVEDGSIVERRQAIEKHQKKLQEEVKAFEARLSYGEDHKKIEKRIEEAKQEVENIGRLASEEKEALDEQGKAREALFEGYNNLMKVYNELVGVRSDHPDASDIRKHRLELAFGLDFDRGKFESRFTNLVDQRRPLSELQTFDGDDFVFDKSKHMGNMRDLFYKVIGGEVLRKDRSSREDLVKGLFSDCFRVHCSLKFQNDDYNRMSPGKRANVLFLLFLTLSDSKVPILIDQPEDNLDNETIYATLNDIVRKAKLERQVIITSHNANLVVNTDSENVVVAEQSNDGRFNYQNGPLENTSPEHGTGIRERALAILEGGKQAFDKRERKYKSYLMS